MPTLQARWAALSPRERMGLALALGLVLAALVWAVLVAPAWRTVRQAPTQSAALDATLERMRALQARAEQLRAQPAMQPQDGLRALQAAASAMGPAAQLQVLGDQVTLTLKQVSAQELATWLAPSNTAGLSPVQVQLQRQGTPVAVTWSGTLVYRLPAGAQP